MTTRRNFLKTICYAAAGAAVGARPFEAGAKAFPAAKSPDKVKVAYIGIGNRGEQVIADFART